MKQSDVIKLRKVLDSNGMWPLIVEGCSSNDFQGGLVLSSHMPAQELYQTPSRQQEWISVLEQMHTHQGGVFLIIADLDEISTEEQEKFLGLVKDRAAGRYHLPNGVRILMPVQSKDRISQKIQRASLFWSVN